MIKIGLKLMGNEMKVLASSVIETGRSMRATNAETLLAVHTLENLFIRLYKTYSPYRDKFVFRISLLEACVLLRFVIPTMENDYGSYEYYAASDIRKTIEKKVSTEAVVFNSIKAK